MKKNRIDSLRTRMRGGYFYERIKYLEQYSDKDELLHAYLNYCKSTYWHGARNYKHDSYLESFGESISIEDVVLPQLKGEAVNAFWTEFPDVLLPYIIPKVVK